MNIENIGLYFIISSIIFFFSVLYYSNFSKELKLFISILAGIEGLTSVLVSGKYNVLLGFVLLFLSLYYIYQNNYIFAVSRKSESPGEKRLEFIKKLQHYLKYAGAFLMVPVFVHSFYFSNGYFGDFEALLVTNFSFWIAYSYIPTRYSWERDFTFLFLNMIVLIVILPATVYLFLFGDSLYNESILIEIFLTKPLYSIFSLTGIQSAYNGNTISFVTNENIIQRVWIATQCSGLFSVQIFLAAFSSFILMEFHLRDVRTLLLLSMGLVMSYIANLLRMFIVMIVGYFYGIDALLFVHNYVGWIIFSTWLFIFWYFFMSPILLGINNNSYSGGEL